MFVLSGRPRRAALILLTLVAGAALVACGEETVPEEAPVEPLPTLPPAGSAPGHWAAAQRGVALDEDDLQIVNTPPTGISAADLRASFGVVVLNRPYVDSLATRCLSPAMAAAAQPRQTAEALLAAFRAKDSALTWDRVAVNVDLLTPDRSALLNVCFEEGGDNADPRFDVVEHRRSIIAAFAALASLPGVAYITVGVDMNQYYHTRVADEQRVDDYTNYVTLYREVYAAIKDVNADVRVGPGISWSVFRTLTVPEVARTHDLEDDSLEALVLAHRQTIQPLLTDGRGGASTADYLAISMRPQVSTEPFRGSPGGEDDPEARAAILEWYRPVGLVAGDLPVVLPVIDWAELGAGAKNGTYLETLKVALSGVDVEWAAWHRMSDLPRDSLCTKYTGRPDPLDYPETYCVAGMFNSSGDASTRGVLEVFTQDP
jgi:hypothetical protein